MLDCPVCGSELDEKGQCWVCGYNMAPCDHPDDYDYDDPMCEYETKEWNAFEELDKEEFRKLEKDDLYYADDEYNAAVEAFEDNVDNDGLEDCSGDD